MAKFGDEKKPRALRAVDSSGGAQDERNPVLSITNVFQLLMGSWAESGQARVVVREWEDAHAFMCKVPKLFQQAYKKNQRFFALVRFSNAPDLVEYFGMHPKAMHEAQKLQPRGGMPFMLARLLFQERLDAAFVAVPSKVLGLRMYGLAVELRVYLPNR